MRSLSAALRAALLLGVALLSAALPARAQTPPPSGMASWRWHTLTPDSLVGRAFHTAAVAYDGQRRVVYAAGDFQGLIRSDDSGRSWRFLRTALRFTHFAVAPHHPDVLYGVTYRSHLHQDYLYPGVYKSRDGGQTWTDVTAALYASGYPAGLPFNRVEVSPTDTSRVFVTGSGGVGSIAFSKDGGRSWRGYNFGGGSHGGGMNAVPSQRVAGRVWGATMHSGTDYFTSLVQFDGWGDVLTKRSFLSLVFREYPMWWQIDGSDNIQNLYVFVNTFDFQTTSTKYYTQATIRNGNIRICQDGEEPGNVLYFCRDNGVFYRLNGATPNNMEYGNHVLDSTDSTLFWVGAPGLYAYGRPSLIATASEDESSPLAFALSAYPNPSHGPVMFAVEGVTSSSAQAQVYDVTGREVARMPFDRSGRAVWDGRDASGAALPSGLYLVRAVQGTQTRTVRVMLHH